MAVGACLAALIPGTVEIATAHHYTAKQVDGAAGARAAVHRLLGRRHHRWVTRLGIQDRQNITNINEVPKIGASTR